MPWVDTNLNTLSISTGATATDQQSLFNLEANNRRSEMNTVPTRRGNALFHNDSVLRESLHNGTSLTVLAISIVR